MFCYIPLLLFLILSFLLVRHTKLFIEAFKHIFRKHHTRQHRIRLESLIKNRIGGSKKTQKCIYKYIGVFILLFILLFVLSMAFALENANTSCGSKILTEKIKDTDIPSLGNSQYPVHIVELGCYTCDETKEFSSYIGNLRLLYEGKIYYQFIDISKPNDYQYQSSLYATCVYHTDQEKFWPFHTKILQHPSTVSKKDLDDFLEKLSINNEEISECISSGTGALLHKESKKLLFTKTSEPLIIVNNNVFNVNSQEELEKIIENNS